MNGTGRYGVDFFGGGVWGYYPDSMLIRMPLTPSELKEVDFPDLVHAEKGLSGQELFAGTTASSKLVFARFKHELDHLVRLLSTSVGLFAHQLDSQFLDQFRWIVDETEPSFFDGDSPLIAAHDLSDESLSSTKSDRHAAIRLWYRSDSLRSGLFDAFESDSQYVAALTMLNWFRDGQTTVEIEATWPPTPKFGSDRLPTTITGRNLLEFFAVLKEMDYSVILSDQEQPWQDLLLDEDYNAVIRLWSLAFPEANLWDVSQEGRLESDVALFVRRAYPMELYACLDVALWPPLVPTGVMEGARSWSWNDISPGHRFVRICEWLQSNKFPLSRISGGDRNEKFTEFQELVCQNFGWPTPTQVLDVWLADNEKKLRGEERELCRLMSISFERAGHSRLAMVDRLLRKRLESPCDFVIGNLTEPQVGVSHLGLVTRRNDGKFMITESEKANWDISPSLLRVMTMLGRFLLQGKNYKGDHPSDFDDMLVTEAAKIYSLLLHRNAAYFPNWLKRAFKPSLE